MSLLVLPWNVRYRRRPVFFFDYRPSGKWALADDVVLWWGERQVSLFAVTSEMETVSALPRQSQKGGSALARVMVLSLKKMEYHRSHL